MDLQLTMGCRHFSSKSRGKSTNDSILSYIHLLVFFCPFSWLTLTLTLPCSQILLGYISIVSLILSHSLSATPFRYNFVSMFMSKTMKMYNTLRYLLLPVIYYPQYCYILSIKSGIYCFLEKNRRIDSHPFYLLFSR